MLFTRVTSTLFIQLTHDLRICLFVLLRVNYSRGGQQVDREVN